MWVSMSGWALCAHFSILYLMLLSPAANRFDIPLRTPSTSSSCTGPHSLLGSGVGLVFCWVCTQRGVCGKKHFHRRSACCEGSLMSAPFSSLSAGAVFVHQPFQAPACFHMSLASLASCRMLYAYVCFAAVIILLRTLTAVFLSLRVLAIYARLYAIVQASSH